METLVAEAQEMEQGGKSTACCGKNFQKFVGNYPAVAILLDCEGHITFCNDYLLNLTDWKKEELLGRNWFEVCVPDEKRKKAKRYSHW